MGTNPEFDPKPSSVRGKDIDSSVFPEIFEYKRISETLTEISLKPGYRFKFKTGDIVYR